MDSQRSAAIEDEYNRCRREFDKIDVNKDGKVTVEELHLMMTSKGYSYSVEDIKLVRYRSLYKKNNRQSQGRLFRPLMATMMGKLCSTNFYPL